MKTCYVLGTSSDLNKVDAEAIKDIDKIGINTCYIWADKNSTPLKHWLAYDRALLYRNDIEAYRYKKETCKWLHYDYTRHPFGDALKRKEHDCRFYQVVSNTSRSFKVDINEHAATLDDWEFSICAAVSLAVGLGYDDIHLRGVTLSGGYWNNANNNEPARDNYYDEIRRIFIKQIIPACMERGIHMRNETPQTALEINI